MRRVSVAPIEAHYNRDARGRKANARIRDADLNVLVVTRRQ
jgi:hypothetical protein